MMAQQAFCAVLGRSYTAAIRTLRLMEVTHTHAGQDRDKNLLSQLQKLKTEKEDADSQIAQDVGHLLRPHALRMTAVAVTSRGKEVVALRIGDEPVVPVRKVVFDCAPAQVGILDRAAQLGRWHWLRFRRR